MDVLDRMPHTIDFLAHVPHDALRVYVMGKRAVHDEAATLDDIAEIAEAFQGLGYGVLQAVSDFNILHGDDHFDAE